MELYLTVNTVAEFICFAVSLIFLYRDKDPFWRMLIPYLFITCATEIGGIFMRLHNHNNFSIYNVYTAIDCIVESFFFYHLYTLYHNHKKLLISWLTIFTLIYFGELIRNHFGSYVAASSSLLSVVIVLASVYYFYLVLKEDQFRQLSVYAPFWWVSGTLCFNFAATACNVFFTYLVRDNTPVMGHSVRYIIFVILNIVLYSSWSYSFICRYRQRISSSLSD